MQINCKLEISESGKIIRVTHENGRIITEMLVRGPLLDVIKNADQQRPILRGRANIFRAEAIGLPGYEYLDLENECILDKTGAEKEI